MITSWNLCTIQDLQDKGEAQLKTGPFGTQLHASDYVETGTPVINVRNIGFGEIREEKLEFIAEQTVQRLSSHLLEAGDIVFGRKGAVERHAFINPKYARWFQGSDCLRLRVKSESIDSRFLSYYFLTEHHKQWMINQCSHGATMASLNQAIISRIPLLLPPIHTQRKIVSILSAYDRLIENNTRRIEILEEMARSIYREWFVKFRFPGHEQVQMVDSELGLIPEGWEALPIDELIKRGILEKNQDGNHGEKHPKSTDYVASGIPFIMAKDLSNNIIDLENCQFISYKQAQSLRVGFAKTGDVLLTHKATMGRVAIVPQVEKFIVLTPQVTYFRIKDYSLLNQAFLYCTFTSDRFQDILSGQSDQSTRKFISITNQRNIKILYPSPSWINKFGEIIKDVLGLKESLYSKNANLRQTRDLLLPRLISGEIDVENLDINTGSIAA
jgi:type I restriction enzyme S subunit